MTRRGFVAGGLVLLAGLGGAVVGSRLLARPIAADAAQSTDPGAGFRVQHGLAEILLRQAGASRRMDPVVLETAELNAFLSRHVESRRLGLRPVVVRAGDGWLDVAGRTSLRALLVGSRAEGFLDLLPRALLDLDVWVSARGRLVVRDGEGEFAVEQARLGTQAVPPDWLWRLLGIERDEALRWRIPRVVERVETQHGRVMIHTRPRGG